MRVFLALAGILVVTTLASAADLPPPVAAPPPRAPAVYVPVVYNWSGFYLGINGGYGFGSSEWNGPAGTSAGSIHPSGFLAGGTIGANLQTGGFVFGIEADGDWQDYYGSSVAGCGGLGGALGLAATTVCKTKSNWLGTVTGRAGWAFDRVLVFGTGGAAFTDILSGPVPPGAFDSSTEVGWTAGGGVEYGITENWTAKVEYLFIKFPNGSCNAACGTPTSPVSVGLSENIVRAGINYKFGGF